MAMPSYAVTVEKIIPWGDYGASTHIFYKSNHSDTSTNLFSSRIEMSADSTQRLYFEFHSNTSADTMPSVDNEPTATDGLYTLMGVTMLFDGQAVAMLGSAKTYSYVDDGAQHNRNDENNENNETYYSFTPRNAKGHSDLVRLLKSATSPVSVRFRGETIYLPVMGFMKIWNADEHR
ncbi:MAG: hypothetical protein ACTHYX_03955 [Psychrobacter sp.]|uniref:hypothetical protein n=1 Tax=Psychrobacter sp. TaxID=56811 RepID=UPI00265677BE|nr:hypothetical protein [Psychrobacter sp.]MDN6307990.1 hypothetical protein [Psychrobacter sp.]